MEILDLLDELEETVDKSVAVPLTGKNFIDKDELMCIIQEMRQKLPENIKEAKWIKSERNRIMMEAQKEANNIIKGAEDKIISMINENEITKKASEQANEMMSNAQKHSGEIKMATRKYTDDLLMSLEKNLNSYVKLVQETRAANRQQSKED